VNRLTITPGMRIIIGRKLARSTVRRTTSFKLTERAKAPI